MMTGIPIVSNLWYGGYHLLIFIVLAAFAIYDMFHKRVPNKALVYFIPVALPSPLINVMHVGNRTAALMFFLMAVLGAIVGFTILLTAAIVSKGGNGVGGGDIKLAAVLGFIYGPYRILSILLIATLLAMPVGLYHRKASGGQTLRLAFVPFLTIGCLIITIIKLLSL